MDLASLMVAMSGAQIRNDIAVAVMRQQFETQKSVLDLLAALRAALPAGQGTRIDKFA